MRQKRRINQLDKTEAPMERGGLVIYCRARCPYCWRAKCLLKRRGYPFEEVDVVGDEELRSRLVEATGRKTVPDLVGTVDRRGFVVLRSDVCRVSRPVG
jgi:glutaredoxin 3